MSKQIKSIAEETVILPDVIAAEVVREISVYLFRLDGTEFTALRIERLEDTLIERAAKIYQARPDIRKKFRRNNTYGRDWLYTFMRHWLAGELKDSRVPASFANGLPI